MAITNAPVSYTGTAGLTPQDPIEAPSDGNTNVHAAPGGHAEMHFANRTSFLTVQNQQAANGPPIWMRYGQGASAVAATTTGCFKIDAGDAAFSLPVGADWVSIYLDPSAGGNITINAQANGIIVTSLV